jgi:hypothetical protein
MKNLLDYLKPKDEAKDEKPEAKDPLQGMGKADLLAMKYEMTHDPEKRAPILVALIKCLVGKGEMPEAEDTDE